MRLKRLTVSDSNDQIKDKHTTETRYVLTGTYNSCTVSEMLTVCAIVRSQRERHEQ